MIMKLKFLSLVLFLSTVLLSQFSMAEDLPLWYNADVINSESLEILPVQVQFQGGSTFNGQAFANEINVNTTNVVDIQATIKINDGLVGFSANVYLPIKFNNQKFFLYKSQSTGELQISQWDGKIDTLKPFMSIEQMPDTLSVPVFQGLLPVCDLKVFLSIMMKEKYFASTLMPIKIKVNSAVPSQLEGEFIVRENFLPNPDGFGFENYTDCLETDLTDEDIVAFLGQEQACYMSPQGKCILSARATTWKQQEIDGGNNGHCYGMAVASVRFMKKLPFKGKTNPADFENGAVTTLELQKKSVRNLIAYYFTSQYAGILEKYTTEIKQTPSQVLETIIARMNTDDPIAVIGVMDRSGSGGHAITPYAVKEKGNDVFEVYVYDNNYPDDANRFVTIDRDKETWQYEVKVNPDSTPFIYEGDATTFTLCAIPLSEHDNLKPINISDNIAEFQFTGQGLQMLIENWDEQRIGYDFETGQYVNEIEDAEMVPVFNIGTPPKYRIPVNTIDDKQDDVEKLLSQMFGVTIGALLGLESEPETNSSLFMQAIDGIVEFGNINLTSGEKFNAVIHPNARTVYLQSESITTQKPTISLTTDDKVTKQGYIYELSELALVKGTDIMILIDDNHNLEVWSIAGTDFTSLDSSAYSLRVTKMDKNGQAFASKKKILLQAGVKTRIEVKKWVRSNNSRAVDKQDIEEGVIEVKVIEK